MDVLRVLAVSGVVIHHWLLYIPFSSQIQTFEKVAGLIQTTSGTVVHLFFILSGCGLTISFYKKSSLSWTFWGKNKFKKIVVPYLLVVTGTFFMANLAYVVFPEFLDTSFRPLTLISYLTFARNFYSPGWDLNPSLWFMPVLIGLYALFPLCMKIVEKHGMLALLLAGLLITYGSIFACLSLGYAVSHQSAFFSFYVIEFCLGIYIGSKISKDALWLDRIIGWRMLCLGICIYLLSWSIQKNWVYGGAFNDLFTALAVYLICMNLGFLITSFMPLAFISFLKAISSASYMMYLIHGPLILFLVKPVFAKMSGLPINAINTMFLAVLYCVVIFFLARILSAICRPLRVI